VRTFEVFSTSSFNQFLFIPLKMMRSFNQFLMIEERSCDVASFIDAGRNIGMIGERGSI